METLKRLAVPLVVLLAFSFLLIATQGGNFAGLLGFLGTVFALKAFTAGLAILFLHGVRKTLFPYINLESFIHGSDPTDRPAAAAIIGVLAWYVLGFWALVGGV